MPITDTSDFFRVEYDDVVILGDTVSDQEQQREGRFGIDEQQKFSVKRARDLSDGSVKIIKLVFMRRFQAKVGDIVFECFRSPKKRRGSLTSQKASRLCRFFRSRTNRMT